MSHVPVPAPQPSPYERAVWRQAQAWRNPEKGWLAQAAGAISEAWSDVADLLCQVPGVGWTVDNVVAGLLTVVNEVCQDTVPADAICHVYRQAGHPVRHPRDIRRLDLAEVDRALAGLRGKYRALAAAEGAATGLAGASGIVPDLVALVALNLRATGEYAAYCGFDIAEAGERLYALSILDHVSRSRSKARDLALSPVLSAAGRVARRQGLQAIEQMGLTRALERAVRMLGLRLTGAKLGQAVPVVGAVVGSGFNAYYTDRVCRTAYHLYRERFLFEKYGPAILQG